METGGDGRREGEGEKEMEEEVEEEEEGDGNRRPLHTKAITLG